MGHHGIMVMELHGNFLLGKVLVAFSLKETIMFLRSILSVFLLFLFSLIHKNLLKLFFYFFSPFILLKYS